MDQSVAWALAIIAFGTWIKTILDASNKTFEAEAEHAAHYSKPEPQKNVDGKLSNKERVDRLSFYLGAVISMGGLVFATLKAGGDTAVFVAILVAVLTAIVTVASAANLYRPKTGKVPFLKWAPPYRWKRPPKVGDSVPMEPSAQER